MSEPVPADQIERIVGVRRHQSRHFGRAVSAEQVFYILHSQVCRDSLADLRECAYSLALDRGIDPDDFPEDAPVALEVTEDGWLIPDEALP